MWFSLSYDTTINHNLHISIPSYHYHQRYNISTVIYLRSWKTRWSFRVNEYIISIPIEAYHDPKYKDHVNVSNCILINHVVSCPDKLLNTIRKSLFFESTTEYEMMMKLFSLCPTWYLCFATRTTKRIETNTKRRITCCIVEISSRSINHLDILVFGNPNKRRHNSVKLSMITSLTERSDDNLRRYNSLVTVIFTISIIYIYIYIYRLFSK